MEIDSIEKLVLEKIKLFVLENEIEISEVNKDTRLIGLNGIFDSMDLVRFIVELEEVLEDELSLDVSLTSEKAMSRSTSPFLNTITLSRYIKELVDE